MTEKDNYPRHIEHVFEFIIPPGQGIERLDVYLTRTVPNASRNKVQEAIDAGAVLVNGKTVKNSRKILPGDVIQCTLLKPPPLVLVPENIQLDIVFEDNRLLVINKPAGMVVHPGFGNRYGTLVNGLLYHYGHRENIAVEYDQEENEDDESDIQTSFENLGNEINERPGIVHRIDKDTSGLLVVAKDVEALAYLAKQFRDRTADREYYALAWGIVKNDEGEIKSNIVRSPRDRKVFVATDRNVGKFAHTTYSVVERFEFATLLRLKLFTGRTHQIRVHCSSIGHPLVSDQPYGGAVVAYSGIKTNALRSKAEALLKTINRQALHARTLGFNHPTTESRMLFDSELPEDFVKAIELCRKRTGS